MQSSRRIVRIGTFAVSTLALTALLGACTSIIGVPDIFLAGEPSALGEGGEAGNSSGEGGGGGEGGRTDANVPVDCKADLQNDPKNCGACGNDCSNGICGQGICILAQDLKSPNSVVVRGGSVYVGLLGGTGAIISCPISGCASPSVGIKDLSAGAVGDPYPWRIAATDTHVWASDYLSGNKGGVRRMLSGGGDFQKFPPNELDRSYGIAVDATAVYWSTLGSPGAIHWCNLPACANGLQVAAVVADGADLVAVAANGTIVWGENSGGIIKRCTSKTACTPQLLVPDFQGSLNDLTIDGTTVYWGTNLGEVLSCSTSGCANATKLVTEDPKATIGAVAAIGTSLYWSSMAFAPDGNSVLENEGVIKTCTLPKCADVRTLATNQKDPSAMAVDANSVYWANSGKRGYSDGIGNLVKSAR